ncbi:response regulator [Mucilaginibacter hurinus]|nr:response regulator [Mucilaginibacter hurinus]
MKRVLILSTERSTVHALQSQLSEFELHVLTDHHSFFETVRSYKPDVILIDFLLSEKNGGGICHQLKSDPSTNSYPVVLLSEFTDRPERFGCDAIVMKPFNGIELVQSIYQLLAMPKAG